MKLNTKMLNFFNKHSISPIYQPIRDIDKQGILIGEPNIPDFEPLFILDELTHLYCVLNKYILNL